MAFPPLPKQRAIIGMYWRPVLVIVGPGSGKTLYARPENYPPDCWPNLFQPNKFLSPLSRKKAANGIGGTGLPGSFCPEILSSILTICISAHSIQSVLKILEDNRDFTRLKKKFHGQWINLTRRIFSFSIWRNLRKLDKLPILLEATKCRVGWKASTICDWMNKLSESL